MNIKKLGEFVHLQKRGNMIVGQETKVFRKFVARLLVCLMILTSVLAIKPVAKAATAEPTFSKNSRNILVGKKYNFEIKNKVKGSTYEWSSSKKSVAKVNSKGVVTGVKKGDAVISCKITTPKNTYTLTAKVTIRKPATDFAINNKVTVLNVGQKYNLDRTLKPASSNDKTSWTTSDSTIAIPNSSGKFTALKKGTVTITGQTLSGKKDTVTIKIVDKAGTVKNQEELDSLLGSGVKVITIKTNADVTFNIPEGDYSKQNLVVNAPNADVVNNGKFKSVDIKQIKANTWYEQAINNKINVSAPNARIQIAENASASISLNKDNASVAIVNNGTVTELALNANANVNISGSSTSTMNVVANTAGGNILTSIPLNLTCNERITLTILPGAEATRVHVASEDMIPIIVGSSSITVIVGTGDSARTVTVAPSTNSTNTGGGGSQPSNPLPTPEVPVVYGSISGRVTAITGSSIGVVTGSAITITDGTDTSLNSIIVDASVLVLKYDGDITSALDSIFTNPNTIVTATNSEGMYSVTNLEDGNYVVVISKVGYKVLIQLTTVTSGVTTVVNGSLIEQENDQTVENGIAAGTLINALTGSPVDPSLEFTVEVYTNFNSLTDLVLTKTVSGSALSLELPEGYYTVKVIDNRTAEFGVTYATTTQNIVVLGGTTFANQDVILSTLKEAGQATFVLTWGELPLDLDSHLMGPVEDDENYHIYFGNMTYPYDSEVELLHLRLDLDDVTSYGPETTTIYKPVAGGIYTFFVYNYSGNYDSTLVNSNAKVVVTTSTGTYTFDVPSGGEELSWVVCTYNSATNEITPINKLVEGNYYTTYMDSLSNIE